MARGRGEQLLLKSFKDALCNAPALARLGVRCAASDVAYPTTRSNEEILGPLLSLLVRTAGELIWDNGFRSQVYPSRFFAVLPSGEAGRPDTPSIRG